MINNFINSFIRKGKKAKVYRNFRQSIVQLKNSKISPSTILPEIVKSLQPKIKFQSKRVSGKIYKVPVPITKENYFLTGIRWLSNSIRSRKEGTLSQNISQELVDSIKKRSPSWKKKIENDKLAARSRTNLKYLKK